MSLPQRRRSTKSLIRASQVPTRPFAPVDDTTNKLAPILKLEPKNSPRKVSKTPPEFRVTKSFDKSPSALLSARVSHPDESKVVKAINMRRQASSNILTARESPSFHNPLETMKTFEDQFTKPSPSLRSRRIKTLEKERDSSNSFDANSKAGLASNTQNSDKESLFLRRRLARQKSEHLQQEIEAYGLITPHLKTIGNQPAAIKVLDILDAQNKTNTTKESYVVEKESFQVERNKKLMRLDSKKDDKDYYIGLTRKTEGQETVTESDFFKRSKSKEDTITRKTEKDKRRAITLEDVKNKYFPLLNSELAIQTLSKNPENFMASTISSRSRKKIPCNESTNATHRVGTKEENEVWQKTETPNDFSWGLNLSSLEELEKTDKGEKPKTERIDIFSNTVESFLEINANNKRILELQKQYNAIDPCVKAIVNEPIGKSAEILVNKRYVKAHRLNHEPEIVTINQGKLLLQPIFMEKAGSMCFTELWDLKQKRKVQEIVGGEINFLRVIDPERDGEPLYKPMQWKKEDIIQKRITKQKQLKRYVAIKANPHDKIGLRVYKDPVGLLNASPVSQRKREPSQLDLSHIEEIITPNGDTEGKSQLRSFSSPNDREEFLKFTGPPEVKKIISMQRKPKKEKDVFSNQEEGDSFLLP